MFIDKDKFEKRILMKYPKGDGNPLWDDRKHKIKPVRLSRFTFNNNEFYVLEYLEENGRMCNTILRKEGNSFIKVPLYDYSNFNRLCVGKKEVSLSLLNGIEEISTLNPVRSLNEVVGTNNYRNIIEPINNHEILDRYRNPRKETTREQMLENALGYFIRAVNIKYGNDVPEEISTVLSIIRSLNINGMPYEEFMEFIRDLSTSLYYCITLYESGHRHPNPEINIRDVLFQLERLIKKYFKYEKEIINSPLVATKEREPDEHYNMRREKFYIALDYDFFSAHEWKHKYYQAYNRKTRELYFGDIFSMEFQKIDYCYEEVLLEYLDWAKRNKERPLSTTVLCTYDKTTHKVYDGAKNIKNGIVIEYVIEQCDSMEKTNGIKGKYFYVEISKNLKFNKKDEKFRNAINGNETLYTYGNTFLAKKYRKQNENITRESMLESALERFTRETKRRYGNLPARYYLIRTMLNQVSNNMNYVEYNRFINEFAKELNLITNSTSADIYFGRVIDLIMNLISKYSKNNYENKQQINSNDDFRMGGFRR